MKKLLIIATVIFATAGLATAQTVVGTDHDLSATGPGAQTNVARVCVFCHTPHQATAAGGQDPLWNHELSAHAAYGVYASNTLNADMTGAEIGGAVAGTAAVSNLCMSCHDGTVAVHTLYNDPNEVASVTIAAGGNVNAAGMMTGTPNVGTDLTNDHPVNFTYDVNLAVSDGGLVNPPPAALLNGGTVQCSSCHDPHDNTFAPFLTMSNTASALCTACHLK